MSINLNKLMISLYGYEHKKLPVTAMQFIFSFIPFLYHYLSFNLALCPTVAYVNISSLTDVQVDLFQ